MARVGPWLCHSELSGSGWAHGLRRPHGCVQGQPLALSGGSALSSQLGTVRQPQECAPALSHSRVSGCMCTPVFAHPTCAATCPSRHGNSGRPAVQVVHPFSTTVGWAVRSKRVRRQCSAARGKERGGWSRCRGAGKSLRNGSLQGHGASGPRGHRASEWPEQARVALRRADSGAESGGLWSVVRDLSTRLPGPGPHPRTGMLSLIRRF